MKTLEKLLKDFKDNFSKDFVMEEALIWLESDINELIKNITPGGDKIKEVELIEHNFPEPSFSRFNVLANKINEIIKVINS